MSLQSIVCAYINKQAFPSERPQVVYMAGSGPFLKVPIFRHPIFTSLKISTFKLSQNFPKFHTFNSSPKNSPNFDTLKISKFSKSLHYFDVIDEEDKVKFEEELRTNTYLQDEVISLSKSTAPWVPYIGLTLMGFSAAKYAYSRYVRNKVENATRSERVKDP